MSDHGKDHPHHGHGHNEHGHNEHSRKEWRWHRDWRTWVVVILMLAAMVGYVLSDNESLQPGKPQQQEMPAAP
jgi:hypothetical protein